MPDNDSVYRVGDEIRLPRIGCGRWRNFVSPQGEDHECRKCSRTVSVGMHCPEVECPYPRTVAGQVDDDRPRGEDHEAGEPWAERVSAIVDQAHAEDWGGKHRAGFCEACAAAYIVAQHAVPGAPSRDDTVSAPKADEKAPSEQAQALRRIAGYDVVAEHGYLDEWTEADAFEAVQGIARRALGEQNADGG